MIVSKPVKHNKNAYSLLFVLLFIKSQREKKWKIERWKKFSVSAGAQNRCKIVVSGKTLAQYLHNHKNKFPVKFIFAKIIYIILSTDKKAKTISLKVFNWFLELQKEMEKVPWDLK